MSGPYGNTNWPMRFGRMRPVGVNRPVPRSMAPAGARQTPINRWYAESGPIGTGLVNWPTAGCGIRIGASTLAVPIVDRRLLISGVSAYDVLSRAYIP